MDQVPEKHLSGSSPEKPDVWLRHLRLIVHLTEILQLIFYGCWLYEQLAGNSPYYFAKNTENGPESRIYRDVFQINSEIQSI